MKNSFFSKLLHSPEYAALSLYDSNDPWHKYDDIVFFYTNSFSKKRVIKQITTCVKDMLPDENIKWHVLTREASIWGEPNSVKANWTH